MFRFSPFFKPTKNFLSSFTPSRWAKIHPGTTNSSSSFSKDDHMFYCMFRNRFRKSILSEVDLIIPSDLRVKDPLFYAVINVDASWDKKHYQVQLGLTVRLLTGGVYAAKSVLINPDYVMPDSLPNPDQGEMGFAESCGVSFGFLTGIELQIPKFHVIVDSDIVKSFLTNNPLNNYANPVHRFLSISNKALWFCFSPCRGSVWWIPSKENTMADWLSRRPHSSLREGEANYNIFWGMIRKDIPDFKPRLLAIVSGDDNDAKVKNASLVTKGNIFDILFKDVLRALEGMPLHPFNQIITRLIKPKPKHKRKGDEFGKFYKLSALNDSRVGKLPYSILILLESAIRNWDGFHVTEGDVEKILDWENSAPKVTEMLFKPARVLLDVYAFRNRLVVPPGSGTVHQVNLEYLGDVVFNTNGLLYPDSVVGTDSLTTMIGGLGVAGWCVGGIEAEAIKLGQPMSLNLLGVVGFKMTGKLRDGVTATDLVVTVTQMLKKHGIVGKFVEFYGEGMSQVSIVDRATIANTCPEYGATMGFFPVDHVTLDYLKLTGRSDETVSMIERFLRANKMFVDYDEPQQERVYSSYLELDLAEVERPKRPL